MSEKLGERVRETGLGPACLGGLKRVPVRPGGLLRDAVWSSMRGYVEYIPRRGKDCPEGGGMRPRGRMRLGGAPQRPGEPDRPDRDMGYSSGLRYRMPIWIEQSLPGANTYPYSTKRRISKTQSRKSASSDLPRNEYGPVFASGHTLSGSSPHKRGLGPSKKRIRTRIHLEAHFIKFQSAQKAPEPSQKTNTETYSTGEANWPDRNHVSTIHLGLIYRRAIWIEQQVEAGKINQTKQSHQRRGS